MLYKVRLGDYHIGMGNWPRRVRAPHPQGLEIGEKLLLKYDETSLKRRYHERDCDRLRTFEKLYCKGEPYRFRGYRDPSMQIDK